ncbi:hypothetical protein BOX15_Mlig034564g1 [Macrostomum lignano]|uniref:Poly [ADP-ribose] polymerase n=2 Tax=Macrostomum lignano TaxID=282301 RepID=A0A267G2P2_9PLAT|nr:hypothetical protein BOX15_Mlig034564g1 [Macrostomum lignano]
MGNQASRRSTAKLARNRASVAESVNLTSSHFDYTVPENLQQSTAHSAVFNQFCRTAKEHRKTSANYCGEINFELLRLPTEQTLPLKERKDIGLELEQLLKSEQCSLADAQVAFEKLRSAKNCPGKVHRQFKKLQQASDEYVEQLQQALNRREISEAMDKWAHCHREFSRMQSKVSATENSLRTLQSSQKTSLIDRKSQLTELERLLGSINALESKFNEWQKLKEEFSASFNDENLTSRYKSLQDTAKLAVRKMESSVCLHIAFNSHVSEFRSWLDQQVLRIGAVLKKSDNEVCLQPLADDLEIKVAEEKLKQLTDIEKCFDGKETDWLIKTRFYGRALIESCRESAYLQRDTEIRISEMESRSKKVKCGLQEDIWTSSCAAAMAILESVRTWIESKSFELAQRTSFEKKELAMKIKSARETIQVRVDEVRNLRKSQQDAGLIFDEDKLAQLQLAWVRTDKLLIDAGSKVENAFKNWSALQNQKVLTDWLDTSDSRLKSLSKRRVLLTDRTQQLRELKSLTEETDARKGDFELLLQLGEEFSDANFDREEANLTEIARTSWNRFEELRKRALKLRESLSASVEIQERFEEELKSFRNWSTEARASEANLLINTSLEPVNAAAASAQLSEVKYLQCEVEHHSSSLTRIAEIGQSLAQSDEFNAGLREHILKQRKGNEKLYNKLKVQLESKKKIADRHDRMCKKLSKFNYLTDKAKSWMKKCHQKLDRIRSSLNTVPVEERDVMLIESEISNGKLHNLTRAIEAGEGLKQKSNCPPYVATHVKEVEGLWCSLDYKLAGVQNEVKHSIRKRLEVRQQLQEADSRLKGLETLFNDLSRQKKVLLNEQVQQVNELKVVKEDGHKMRATLEQLSLSASMQRYGVREQHESLLNRCQALQKTVQTLLDELSNSVKDQQTWADSVEKFKKEVQEWIELCSDCTVQENDATEHSENWRGLAEQLAKTSEEMQLKFDAMQQKYLRLADSHNSNLSIQKTIHQQMPEISGSFFKAKDGAVASLDALQNRIQLAELNNLVSAALDWANSIDILLAEIENRMLVEPVAQEELQLIDDCFLEGDSKFDQAVEAGTALMNKQSCRARVRHQLADLEVQFLQLEQHKQQVKISVLDNLQKAEVLKDEINRLDPELMTAEAKLKRCCDRQETELPCRKQQRSELEAILSEIQVMKNRFTILCLDSDISCAKHDEFRINSCRAWYYELEDTAQKQLGKLRQSVEHHENFEKKLKEMRKKVCDVKRKFEQTNAARNLVQSLSYADLQKQLELLRSYHSDVDSCSSDSSLGSLLRNVIDTMIDKRHSEPRRTVEAQYESFKNEIDSLKSSITVAEDLLRIKLDNTDEFDAQRRSATDWIKKKHIELKDLDTDRGPNSEKARQLRAIEDTLHEGEDLLSAATVTAEQMMQQSTCPFRVGRQHLQLAQSWSMLISLLERLKKEVYAADSGQDGRRRLDGELQQKFRLFNCGHWEELDREASSRLVSNEFCSKCWPVTAQMQRNGLFSRPRDDDQVKRTMLWENDPENSLEYIQVLDRVTRYVKPEHNIKVRILTIEKIENPVLDRRVYHVYDQLVKKNSEPLLLIHGTTGDKAERIIQEGFQVGTGGMYGAGIYFATDTSKSAQYAIDSRVKTLLLCNVVLGKYMVCDAPRNDLNLQTVVAAGFDSVFAKRNSRRTGGVLNDEYIVYRPEQASPRYLVKFEV